MFNKIWIFVSKEITLNHRLLIAINTFKIECNKNHHSTLENKYIVFNIIGKN